MMIWNSTADPARIALDLWSRLTPKGTGPSMALLEATCTADVEQIQIDVDNVGAASSELKPTQVS